MSTPFVRIDQGEKPRLMIFVSGYFDESLPGQPEANEKLIPEYVVVAGLVDLSDKWLPFSVDWGRVLDSPRSIEYFHGVEANGKTGQFEGFSDEERNAKVIPLINIIRESRPQAIISAVHPHDYERVKLEFGRVMPEDAYIFCLHHVMLETVELNRNRITAEPFKISLIFENNRAMRKKAGVAFDLIVEDHPEYAQVLDSFTFGEKKQYKPLQAADAIAYDLNKEFTRQLKNPKAKMRPSLRAIFEKVSRRGLYWPWNYKNLRELFEARYHRLILKESK